MSEKRYELDVRLDMPKLLIDNNTNEKYNLLMVNDIERIVDKLNELSEENGQLKKENNILYTENIQLRRILVHYKDLINDVKYLEEKGVFDGKKDKKNIWDVEPVVEKHS